MSPEQQTLILDAFIGLLIAFFGLLGGVILYYRGKLENRKRVEEAIANNKITDVQLDELERKVSIKAQESILAEFSEMKGKIAKLEGEQFSIIKNMADSQKLVLEGISDGRVDQRQALVVAQIDKNISELLGKTYTAIQKDFSDLQALLTTVHNPADILKTLSDMETRLSGQIRAMRLESKHISDSSIDEEK